MSGAPLEEWLVPLLVCPACGDALELTADDGSGAQGLLAHPRGACTEAYPVIDGIPRLLLAPHRGSLVGARGDWFRATAARAALAERWSRQGGGDPVVRDFDYEWARYRGVGADELERLFAMYFDVVPPGAIGPDRLVLDAGCGSGRWAEQVAARGARVVAVDLGRSVEVARERCAGLPVACVQADLRHLPLRGGTFDLAYSLGVLHHVEGADGPERGVEEIARALRPGGGLLLYLYYALETRGALYRMLFVMVDLARALTSRLPRAAARVAALALALLVYWPLSRLSSLLRAAGLRRSADALPLAFYRDLSFATIVSDSLDRFGTRRERRYRRSEIGSLLARRGFAAQTFSERAPFWHVFATRG